MKNNLFREIKKAALYIRVSTDKQEELSPDAQIRLCADYAKKNNLNVLPEYIYMENGISGRKADKRPEFLRMISEAKSKEHPFDVILVWKFSRFARNQEESIVYKSLLKKESNVEVISVSEPLIDGPFGSLIERIIEWMDEYYSIRLSGEVKRGMEEKALRCGYQSPPCLGYKAVGDGSPFTIVEDEYKIYQFIIDQFDFEHKDPTAIARAANDLGYRTKRGNLFEARTVKGLLRNPFYSGKVVWNGHTFNGLHEARISEERFEQRIAYMDSIYLPKNRRNISGCRHWLSGIIKCPICSASLSFNSCSKSPFFSCWKYGKGFHKESISISEKKLIKAVLENFEDILSIEQDFSFRCRPLQSNRQSELELLENRLEKLSSREKRIKLAYENEIDTLNEYKENKLRLQEERDALIEKINSMKVSDNLPIEVTLQHLQSVYDVIENPNVSYELKGEFMRSVVEDIIYDKENQKLIFHFYYSS